MVRSSAISAPMTRRGVLRLLESAGSVGALSLLAGCGPTGGLGFGSSGNSSANLSAPTTPVQSGPLAPPSQIGNGPIHVGLILPLTQNNQPSVVGISLRNAVELAVTESGSQDLTILVQDDQSIPSAAHDAAQSLASMGVDLFLGPLYAADVREVGNVARAAGKPVIAFSTDTTTASRGVYLLSFLVETYVDRVLNYAIAHGKKSFAILAPDDDYGTVALAEFQQVAAQAGGRVQAIERYSPGGSAASAQKIAASLPQIDALFIPEQADAMLTVAPTLSAAGIDSSHIQILGTGIWNDARVLSLPQLQGAWFAAPENAGFAAFAQRYRAKYGADPTRIATLGYDAASLVAALARTQGSSRFSDAVLTNSAGFNGADGVFRFRADGRNERGLAVMQIANGTTNVVSPAPRNFNGQG